MIKRKAFAIGLAAVFIAVRVSDAHLNCVWQNLFNSDFEPQFIQAGAPVSNLVDAAKQGEHRPIAPLWESPKLLLVTPSLTCPVSRREALHVEKLRQKSSKRVSIVMLYSQEARAITKSFGGGLNVARLIGKNGVIQSKQG